MRRCAGTSHTICWLGVSLVRTILSPVRCATKGHQKKGVLWNIHRIVSARRPRMVLLRTSFACSSPHWPTGFCHHAPHSISGYVTEQAINAADYGMPQRRRRVFILARRVEDVVALHKDESRVTHLLQTGPFAQSFPCFVPSDAKITETSAGAYPPLASPEDITEDFEAYDPIPRCRRGRPSPYMKAGVHAPMADGVWRTTTVYPPTDPNATAGWDV